MRWLKALVIAMGVLIVLGLVAVAYGLARNAEKLAANRQVEAGEATGGQAPGGQAPGGQAVGTATALGVFGEFGEVALQAPAGCRIAEARPLDGKRLLIRLDGTPSRGCQQVLLIDLTDGQVRGQLTLSPD